jgi:uncharacterized protein YbjT (DUF2867 family)
VSAALLASEHVCVVSRGDKARMTSGYGGRCGVAVGRRTAVIFGATGLVGRACLDLALSDERYGRVISIGRRAPARTNGKLVVHQAALASVEALVGANLGAVDDAYCCLGTTIAKAGSQQAFRRVDLDYVVNAAHFAKHQGACHFLLVTAVGADAASRVFYSRVKGEAESAVAKVGLASLSIFRPSLILGPREESRLKERAAKWVAAGLAFAMIGSLTKYRPIEAETVARAMLAAAAAPMPGVTVFEFDRMTTASGGQ